MLNDGEKFDKDRVNNLNPIVLAFIGDAVYSLYVREKLSLSCDSKTGELNKKTVAIVNAGAQSKLLNEILPILTEEEIQIYKRGRNAKKGTHSKSASIKDYNNSTGFEALIGYLYLTGNIKRINEILNEGNNNEGWRQKFCLRVTKDR